MSELKDHLIRPNVAVRDALERLNALGSKLTLFITDEKRCLFGAVTDGDIRRSLLDGLELSDPVSKVMNAQPHSFKHGKIDNDLIREFRMKGIFIVPVLNKEGIVQEIIDLSHIRPALPLDAVLMAGGRGLRLKPLTDDIPKPLIKVGEKPIIEHTLDHLVEHGINNIHVSVNYKKEMIKAHLDSGDHSRKISYLEEDTPLGTAGSLSLMSEGKNEAILLMNSDLLTDLDIEDLYNKFNASNADMAVATSVYKVEIPYAILQVTDGEVTAFEEKPIQQYSSNAGIYLIKRVLLEKIPKNTVYNATDLLEDVLKSGGKVIAYPISGYWVDIGRHADLEKARELTEKKRSS